MKSAVNSLQMVQLVPDLTKACYNAPLTTAFLHWQKRLQSAQGPSMMLCHEALCTIVKKVTLATPALWFKLHAHWVGKGTMLLLFWRKLSSLPPP